MIPSRTERIPHNPYNLIGRFLRCVKMFPYAYIIFENPIRFGSRNSIYQTWPSTETRLNYFHYTGHVGTRYIPVVQSSITQLHKLISLHVPTLTSVHVIDVLNQSTTCTCSPYTSLYSERVLCAIRALKSQSENFVQYEALVRVIRRCLPGFGVH